MLARPIVSSDMGASPFCCADVVEAPPAQAAIAITLASKSPWPKAGPYKAAGR
jgi:hypothetical protein